jgi:hypothetical protein
MKKFLKMRNAVVSVVVLWLSVCATAWSSQSVTLTWNASADTNVSRYFVYYGSASGIYTNKVALENVTSATISDLVEGTTYFFAVTACDDAGLESVPSNEAVFAVPSDLLLISGPSSGNPVSIRFQAALGHWYELQAAVDLSFWTTIEQTATATSNAWIQFLDHQASLFPMRFYRLIIH